MKEFEAGFITDCGENIIQEIRGDRQDGGTKIVGYIYHVFET